VVDEDAVGVVREVAVEQGDGGGGRRGHWGGVGSRGGEEQGGRCSQGAERGHGPVSVATGAATLLAIVPEVGPVAQRAVEKSRGGAARGLKMKRPGGRPRGAEAPREAPSRPSRSRRRASALPGAGPAALAAGQGPLLGD